MINYISSGSFHTLTHWQSGGETWGNWQSGETSFITFVSTYHYVTDEDGQLYAVGSGIVPDDYPEGFTFRNFDFSISNWDRVKVRLNGVNMLDASPHYYYTQPIPISNMWDVWGNNITPEQFKARPDPDDRAIWILNGYVETIAPDTVQYYTPGSVESGIWNTIFKDSPVLTLTDDTGKVYNYKYLYQQIYKGKPSV